MLLSAVPQQPPPPPAPAARTKDETAAMAGPQARSAQSEALLCPLEVPQTLPHTSPTPCRDQGYTATPQLAPSQRAGGFPATPPPPGPRRGSRGQLPGTGQGGGTDCIVSTEDPGLGVPLRLELSHSKVKGTHQHGIPEQEEPQGHGGAPPRQPSPAPTADKGPGTWAASSRWIRPLHRQPGVAPTQQGPAQSTAHGGWPGEGLPQEGTLELKHTRGPKPQSQGKKGQHWSGEVS